jgi:hypothetical protein
MTYFDLQASGHWFDPSCAHRHKHAAWTIPVPVGRLRDATGTMAPRPPHGSQPFTGARSPAAADPETVSDEET